MGAKIIGFKMLVSEKDAGSKHYTEDLAKRRGERVREIMINMLTSGPIVAIALEGIEIVEVARKMVGATEPKSAAPGTIRGDYAHVSFGHVDKHDSSLFNLIHASATVPEAEVELAIWFKAEELVQFDPAYTKFTLNTK
jgi:nucleoside-diphosphate kinase